MRGVTGRSMDISRGAGWIPKLLLLTVTIQLGGCSRVPTDLDADSVGSPTQHLVARDDSITKGAYASWLDGQLSYWVFVSETVMPGTGTQVWLSYGAYHTMTYEYAFYGSGFVSPKDVVGGQGSLRLRTNTDPSMYPDFVLVNHAGGPIEVLWQAIPQTVWRWHDVGSHEVGPLVIKYVTGSISRDATVTGVVVGSPIPSMVSGSLWQAVSHSVVLEPGS